MTPAIPLLGFGTYPLVGEAAERGVLMALDVGYRHLDTAQAYGNEKSVGAALRQSGLPRSDLFITTKIGPDRTGASSFRPAVEQSIADLGGPVDLLLIHWPPPDGQIDGAVERLAAAAEAGLARHIGVSNFPAALLRRATARSPVKLVNNQVEFHPLIDQGTVLAEARKLGMTLSAYCPLARGRVLQEPAIIEIARRHGRPPSEIALRWIIQQGVAALPMTTKRANAESNFRALGFTLEDDDMAAISTLRCRHLRLVSPASMAGRWDSQDDAHVSL